MNADIVLDMARATLAGHLPFPQIVGTLVAEGVESYRVDYVARQMNFHSLAGAVVVAPLAFDHLPDVAPDFDIAALQAAILDSQRNGQPFLQFSQRAVAAGVYAFLRGQRVIYLGRQGDQHTEWFPGAGPQHR